MFTIPRTPELEDSPLSVQLNFINNLRLGMIDFTKPMGQKALNDELDGFLPNLTDDELCNWLNNLNWAYARTKFWESQNRKKQIALEVNEKCQKLLEEARDRRTGGKNKGKKIKKSTQVPQQFSPASLNSSPATNGVVKTYDSDPVVNKSIKEMLKVTNGDYGKAVAVLISLGALPQDYKLIENL